MAYSKIAGIGELTLNYGNSTNKTVLQTLDNIICFCGDITGVVCNSNTAICKLPNTIDYPTSDISFPMSYKRGTAYYTNIFYLTTNGEIKSRTNLTQSSDIYLNGLTINLNNNFYNSTIGNNDQSQMTRPMGVS